MGCCPTAGGGEAVSEEKYMLSAGEVARLLGIGISKAYALIREWNRELQAMGKLTIPGKINKKYFERKMDI